MLCFVKDTDFYITLPIQNCMPQPKSDPELETANPQAESPQLPTLEGQVDLVTRLRAVITGLSVWLKGLTGGLTTSHDPPSTSGNPSPHEL